MTADGDTPGEGRWESLGFTPRQISWLQERRIRTPGMLADLLANEGLRPDVINELALTEEQLANVEKDRASARGAVQGAKPIPWGFRSGVFAPKRIRRI
jgi:hypothetical protein